MHSKEVIGFVTASLQGDLTLSPTFVDTLENNSLMLTCSSPTYSRETQWGTLDQKTTFSNLIFKTEGQC